MSIRINEIKTRIITLNNGKEECQVWAVDTLGRDWHIGSSKGSYPTYKLVLGSIPSYDSKYLSAKEGWIKWIKELIDRQNREFERFEGLQKKSEEIETIKV